MLKITNQNIEQFAEEMFQFNCEHEYNRMCFSTNDILREQNAFAITDKILEELDQAGFDMQKIKAFKVHGWRVDDLISPVVAEPVLFLESEEYENYFKRKELTLQ